MIIKTKKSLKIFTILLILFFLSFNVVLASDSIYVWSSEAKSVNNIQTSTGDEAPPISSVNDAAITSATPSTNLSLESGGAVLIEQSSGKVLYNHNMHEQLRPASVTKVMSILLIMEAIDSGKLSYTDEIPCSENASRMGGSQIWLDTTESLTVDEMLKAICVVSANDCTVAMAEYLAGSEAAFVEKMNTRAKELGMNDTTFKNCHGIDEDGHVTSAYDIALMSRELLQNHPDITKYTTIWMDSLRDGKSELVNTNKLIRNYKGATGLKTGSTSVALYNLSASATRDELSLIAVIMKAPTTALRFAEAQKLLDYGFSNFSYKSLGYKGDVIKEIQVDKGIQNTVNAVLEADVGVLLMKNQDKEVTQSITLSEQISAPVTQGEVLGKICYYLDNNEISSTSIVAGNTVEKNTAFNIIESIYLKWFSLLRV